MPSTTDHNLLFGILAFQNDLITRAQLIAGLKAWVDAKHRPLADLLEEADALAPKHRGLLQPLVDEYLRQHGDDPQECLAAMSSVGSLYDDLVQVGNGQLAASLERIAITRIPEELETAQLPPAGEAAIDATRFRILRRRFEGGMGTIYEAEDLELKRVVALKEIRPEIAHDRNAQVRFTYEAEVTGLLEHPSVVPIYGLGTYRDGRPYYAMRFIKGSDLARAIREFHHDDARAASRPRELSPRLRELLGRFIDVCQAVHYAHDRGVLHRDLKPGNIMLGEYGETLVVDWGLAKVVGRKDPPTLAGEPPIQPASGSNRAATRGTVGTYDYMAPEQALSRQELIGPAADIFSLGATLYQLLTGRTPYAGLEKEEKLRAIEEARFPAPRQLDKSIPRALEAICLKAMAREPADRYATAKDMVVDLERYLADEPVAAWREPISDRVRRWMRRHRPLVASAAVAALVALVVLAVSLVVIQRSYTRELAARREAQKNLALARGAVDEMLVQVGSDQLVNVPQMEPVRAVLLTKAQRFYKEFSGQSPDDPNLALEVALAHRSLGDVFRILKRTPEGEAAYQAAIARLGRLRQTDRENALYQQELATTHNWLGESLRPEIGRQDEARQQYETASALQRTLAAKHPDNYQYKQELARSTYNLGILSDVSGQWDAAIARYDEAIQLLGDALALSPPEQGAARCRQELARCYNNRGKSLRSKGRAEDAAKSYALAIEQAEPLTRSDPRNREYRWELAIYCNNLANLQAQADPKAALENNARAVAHMRELARPIPEVANELGNALNTGAHMRPNHDEARAALDEARQIFAGLAAEFTTDPQYHDRLGNALFGMGALAFRESPPNYQSALDLARQAAHSHQEAYRNGDRAVGEHLARDHHLLAFCHFRLQNYDDAAKTVGEYRLLFEKLALADTRVAAEILVWPAEVEQSDLAPEKKGQFSTAIDAHALALVGAAIRSGYRDADALRKSKADGGKFHRLHGPQLDALLGSIAAP